MSGISSEQQNGVRFLASKVPEITIFFWIIKILCTTVGETAADLLNTNLNVGLTGTSVIMAILFAISLVFQFKAKRYIPWLYWLCVVLISVVGTLVSDNLTDNFGVSLITTTIIFSILLAISFFAWYRSEHTLSIHSIRNRKREAFYWLSILFTFALGTSAGDLTAERLNWGYLLSVFLFGALIVAIAVATIKFKLNAILGFWIAYVLTRPLGASIGDYLSQARTDGGLGLGTIITSIIFLTAILATVVYLTLTKKDIEPNILANNSQGE